MIDLNKTYIINDTWKNRYATSTVQDLVDKYSPGVCYKDRVAMYEDNPIDRGDDEFRSFYRRHPVEGLARIGFYIAAITCKFPDGEYSYYIMESVNKLARNVNIYSEFLNQSEGPWPDEKSQISTKEFIKQITNCYFDMYYNKLTDDPDDEEE